MAFNEQDLERFVDNKLFVRRQRNQEHRFWGGPVMIKDTVTQYERISHHTINDTITNLVQVGYLP